MILGLSLRSHAATCTVQDAGTNPDALPGDGACATSLGTCSFRAALEESNALPGADSIELALTSCAASSLPDVTDVVVVLGAPTTLQGTPSAPIRVASAGSLTLDRVRLTGFGQATIPRSSSGHGALACIGAALTVRDSSIESSFAFSDPSDPDNAVVRNIGGSLVLERCSVIGCGAETGTAGLVLNRGGQALIEDCELESRSLESWFDAGLLTVAGGSVVVRRGEIRLRWAAPSRGFPSVVSLTSGTLALDSMSVRLDGPVLMAGIDVVGGSLEVTRSDIHFGGPFQGAQALHVGPAGIATLVGTNLAGSGGMIRSEGSVLLRDVSILDVLAPSVPTYLVQSSGSLDASRCVFSRNAGGEGNFVIEGGIAHFAACKFSDDSTEFSSRAVLDIAAGAVRVEQCFFVGSSAVGGAIRLTGGTLMVENSTVADGTRDGIAVSGGSATLAHCTITDNGRESSAATGRLYTGLRQSGSGVMTLRACIVAGNGAVGVVDDCDGRVVSLGDALVEAPSCDWQAGAGDLLAVDPLLGPLEQISGFTAARAPLLGSPAVDAVDIAACLDIDGAPLVIDQRDTLRPLDGEGDGVARCDIGAVEACDPSFGTGVDTDADGIPDGCDASPGCVEPRMLVVQRVAGGILLRWRGASGQHFDVIQGSISTLPTAGDDLFVACDIALAAVEVEAPAEDSYFLIRGRCGTDRSAFGRDSSGNDHLVDSTDCP